MAFIFLNYHVISFISHFQMSAYACRVGHELGFENSVFSASQMNCVQMILVFASTGIDQRDNEMPWQTLLFFQ